MKKLQDMNGGEILSGKGLWLRNAQLSVCPEPTLRGQAEVSPSREYTHGTRPK